MEQRLQQATERGARAIIVRAGDCIGANTSNTWIGELIKRTKRGYALTTLQPTRPTPNLGLPARHG